MKESLMMRTKMIKYHLENKDICPLHGLAMDQWRRYARSWQVLCPATEKIGPGAETCL